MGDRRRATADPNVYLDIHRQMPSQVIDSWQFKCRILISKMDWARSHDEFISYDLRALEHEIVLASCNRHGPIDSCAYVDDIVINAIKTKVIALSDRTHRIL